VADAFFAEVVAEAQRRRLLSSEHFTVDGTLLEAWASLKSWYGVTVRQASGRVFRRRAADVSGRKWADERAQSTTSHSGIRGLPGAEPHARAPSWRALSTAAGRRAALAAA
jgi:hypothetical protein